MTLTLNSANLMASPELLDIFLRLVREDIVFLRGAYPNFDRWLSSKVIPGIKAGERTVIVEQREGHPVGLLIVKHTRDERKLCTLRVRPEYEFRGMGVRLFTTAFEVLATDRPLLSVSELALPKFSRLFAHFGFACEESYEGLYLPKVQELSFNGTLNIDFSGEIFQSQVKENTKVSTHAAESAFA